jgi:hypothetical protein
MKHPAARILDAGRLSFVAADRRFSFRINGTGETVPHALI